MLSVIIPSYKGPYLNRTVKDLLDKSTDKIEILVHLDGPPAETPIEDERVSYTKTDKSMGMRYGINEGLRRAKGTYIMKCDDHCCFAPGFDTELKKDFEKHWLVIPRRYALHADNWDRVVSQPIKDYHFLSFPSEGGKWGSSLYPQEWIVRGKERRNGPTIDDTMTFQGSCYFADREFFMNLVGFLDDSPDRYTSFSGEPLEVGSKYWLSGKGEVKVNKNTWYAHLFKNERYYVGVGASERLYKINLKARSGHIWGGKHWFNNEEPGMEHKLSWLVEKFWPVPTWPENYKELC